MFSETISCSNRLQIIKIQRLDYNNSNNYNFFFKTKSKKVAALSFNLLNIFLKNIFKMLTDRIRLHICFCHKLMTFSTVLVPGLEIFKGDWGRGVNFCFLQSILNFELKKFLVSQNSRGV